MPRNNTRTENTQSARIQVQVSRSEDNDLQIKAATSCLASLIGLIIYGFLNNAFDDVWIIILLVISSVSFLTFCLCAFLPFGHGSETTNNTRVITVEQGENIELRVI